MAKQPRGPILSAIEIDPAFRAPLYQQVYGGVRRLILMGHLRTGDRLPSTRTLALDLGVSRNTVTLAFDQLYAEGLIEARTGDGTYVACVPAERRLVRPRQRPDGAAAGAAARALSTIGRRFAQGGAAADGANRCSAFTPCLPAVDAFPREQWSRLVQHHSGPNRNAEMGYGGAAGLLRLRRAIRSRVALTRGAACDPEQVFITSGTRQANDLIIRLLVDPGDRVVMEDPGFDMALDAFRAAGARIVPAAVDDDGLLIGPGTVPDADVRLVHVTPAHQFPTGAVMSLPRRLALIAWAKRAGAWIVENDFGGEYCYSGRPIIALQGLDDDDRVIHVGSFSAVMAPNIMLGYLIVPPDLVDPLKRLKGLVEGAPSYAIQAAMADFMLDGYLDAHVRRITALHRARQDALCERVHRRLDGCLAVRPSATGLNAVGRASAAIDADAISRLAATIGIELPSLSRYHVGGRDHRGVLFGFGAVPVPDIVRSIDRLAAALDTELVMAARA